MDADMLDGQDGSFYTNISARLGYIPLDAATYVAADILAKLSTVDGSGSGLDADLLDGREGGYYTDIPSRLGYAPVSKGGDTMSGPLDIVYPGAALTLNSSGVAVGRLAMQGDGSLVLYRDDGAGQKPIYSIPSQTDPFNVHRTITRLGNLVWDAGNDGAGSGMDADMLDGHDGAFYADINARLGFAPIQQGTGIGQNGNVVKIGWNNSSRLSCTVDAYDVGNFVFDANLNSGEQAVNGAYMRRNGYHLWGPENDGSGSGLDADLLDGLEASAFARMADFGSSQGDHGYQRLPSGLILQWGSVVAPAGGVNNVTFPIAFPNQCLAAFATNQSGGVPAAWAGAGNIARTGMTVGHASSSLSASSAGTAAFWFAIGR